MKGFTVVELLVAMMITMIVAAATLSLVGPAHDAFQVQPETSDLQQRVRVGIDALQRDLMMAGAGMYAAGAVGPLHGAVAPVMPYRAFGTASDSAVGRYFRPDAISVLFVRTTASQSTLAAPLSAGGLEIAIEASTTCPAATAASICGLTTGDQVLLFDDQGGWDVFGIDRTASPDRISLTGPAPARGYRAGANLTEARALAYALRPDPATGAFQLVLSDGGDPAQPVLDHVVTLEFRYWGDPQPPRVIDESAPAVHVSYGPAPPAADASLPGWPMGENCSFALVDGRHQSRMAALGAAGPLVELDPAVLTDGPWCPDAGARNRFDADLLRVRRVRVRLRVQSALRSLRGPAGTLFTQGGLARAGTRYVPDLEVALDVTPRNLNLDVP